MAESSRKDGKQDTHHAQRKELGVMLGCRAGVSQGPLCEQGQTGPESRMFLILHSAGNKGSLLILLGKSEQLSDNIPKLAEKPTGEKLTYSLPWRLGNESSGKLKEGVGDTFGRTSLHPECKSKSNVEQLLCVRKGYLGERHQLCLLLKLPVFVIF